MYNGRLSDVGRVFSGVAVDGLVVSQSDTAQSYLEGSCLAALQEQAEFISVGFWMMLVAARKVAQNPAGSSSRSTLRSSRCEIGSVLSMRLASKGVEIRANTIRRRTESVHSTPEWCGVGAT